MRAFLALPLSSEVRATLATVAADLRRDWPARTAWVKPGQMHLTLWFFARLDRNQRDTLVAELTPALGTLPPFPFELTQLGAFPAASRPAVIWAGVAPNASLLQIYATITNCLSNLGFPSEKKPFSPHLTLGRVKDRMRVSDGAQLLSRHAGAVAGRVEVTAVILYESTLTPDGPVYTELARFPLAAAPEIAD